MVLTDWRTASPGMVQPAQWQGACGDCWAFSAAAAIEGQWFKKFKQQVKVSEQNLNDCSYPAGVNGCQGGWMSYAFDAANKGVNSLATYPVSRD